MKVRIMSLALILIMAMALVSCQTKLVTGTRSATIHLYPNQSITTTGYTVYKGYDKDSRTLLIRWDGDDWPINITTSGAGIFKYPDGVKLDFSEVVFNPDGSVTMHINISGY